MNRSSYHLQRRDFRVGSLGSGKPKADYHFVIEWLWEVTILWTCLLWNQDFWPPKLLQSAAQPAAKDLQINTAQTLANEP